MQPSWLRQRPRCAFQSAHTPRPRRALSHLPPAVAADPPPARWPAQAAPTTPTSNPGAGAGPVGIRRPFHLFVRCGGRGGRLPAGHEPVPREGAVLPRLGGDVALLRKASGRQRSGANALDREHDSANCTDCAWGVCREPTAPATTADVGHMPRMREGERKWKQFA